MLGHTAATTAATLLAAAKDPNTQGLADWLQKIFGPLFLAIVGVVALFFLFTREITRFVQFIVLAIAIAVIFYYPGLIQSVAHGIASALGVTNA
jgi:cation transport ATPase